MSKHEERARALCSQWRVEQRHLSPVWHDEVAALIAAVERETREACAAERAGLVAALRSIRRLALRKRPLMGAFAAVEDFCVQALRAAGEER